MQGAATSSTASPVLEASPKLLLIGGKWQAAQSGETIETRNPSTGEIVGHFQSGKAADVDLAVAAARAAFEGHWSKTTPFQRQELLLKWAHLIDAHFEELTWLDVLEMGVPISVALTRRQRVIGMIRFYAGLATALHGETIDNSMPGEFSSFTLKEPLGVVGAIIPWNGPLVAAVWKIAPALATGCTMVLKPSEEASLTVIRLAELLQEAGMPDGVLNVVTGYGHEAGAALAAHKDVDKIAFTGSTATGRRLVEASAGNFKRLSLELGGKSPNIVFADANFETAVPGAAMAVFANTGQICSAGTRLFVEAPIYEEFCARVAEFGRKLVVGNSASAETQVGPLVSTRQLEVVQRYFDAGAREGAVALSGGERLYGAQFENGNFVAPTVFTHVRDDMAIAREEIFGPVISALPFSNMEEVVARANASEFGLGSGVWTQNLGTAHKMARAMRAGVVWINCYQAGDPAVPFGGYKESGYGRESGIEHMHEFLQTKSVWINLNG
ncbi:betaine-aldehyde dehydrogenase [Sphingobium lactosutens]|uniref:aldehyde dehydrogenase family protein n=1 Tax=Sphingobium lactosutens TaxID=522773 RepID=UPI0015C079A8|nr:aldehyde dehydrogenase family protein [Sphingobium lactosutens]NWK97390.1 betaine-aldehyde dehydrogenase [Sphingobium lactosutens]